MGRAREHILPRWLQNEWQIAENVIEPTHFNQEFAVVSQRRHTLDGLVAGNVCARCNNGWMSALEANCKDMILDLASGRRRIIDLHNQEALHLARWAAKTAFTLHTSSNCRRTVPEGHIYKLDSNSYRLPDNVAVVGHTYNRGAQEFSWFQSTHWEIFSENYTVSEEDVANLRSCGYKIAIRLGGLFLMIFHNPWHFARPCLWKDRHVPLYPRAGPCAWRIGGRAWPGKADVRFQVFATMLALRIDHSQPGASPNGGPAMSSRDSAGNEGRHW